MFNVLSKYYYHKIIIKLLKITHFNFYSQKGVYILPYRDFYTKLHRNSVNFLTTLNALMPSEFQNTTDITHNYSRSASFSFQESSNLNQWSCVSDNLDTFQSERLEKVQFWIDGVGQLIIGIVGIISNLLAILVLSRTRIFGSIFGKLLACLLICHSFYIVCVGVNEKMYPSWYRHTEQVAKTSFTIYLCYLARPLGTLMRYSSTLFTSLMARQQYLALCYPIQYRNSGLTRNHNVYVITNVMLVLITSALFTFPIYFERSIDVMERTKVLDLNATHFKYVSSTYKDQLHK